MWFTTAMPQPAGALSAWPRPPTHLARAVGHDEAAIGQRRQVNVRHAGLRLGEGRNVSAAQMCVCVWGGENQVTGPRSFRAGEHARCVRTTGTACHATSRHDSLRAVTWSHGAWQPVTPALSPSCHWASSCHQPSSCHHSSAIHSCTRSILSSRHLANNPNGRQGLGLGGGGAAGPPSPPGRALPRGGV